MSVSRRIGLWFISLLLAVGLFSLLWFLMPSVGSVSLETLSGVFLVTLLFALPVACLFLPIVIGLKDAEERRIWMILGSGILIGPLSMALWGLLLQWRGEDSHTVWYGDPLLGVGGFASMFFAAVVGSLTTLLYVIVLRVIHRRFRKSVVH
jgi:drug/metabolite transporter (DMT)-like permease